MLSRARETAHDRRQHATRPEDLARLFVKYANIGDVDGLVGLYEAKTTRLKDGTVTAEVARLQPDGSGRWVLDQPAIAKAPKEDK